VRDYEYERGALATRMYVLIHNQAKHLIETDHDCLNHKRISTIPFKTRENTYTSSLCTTQIPFHAKIKGG
jgi:hypothetical protein